MDVNKDSCSGCRRRATLDEDFKCCSNCKVSYYCSKDCQVKDWKSHKPKCQQNVAAKKQASQNYQKRVHRLLQEWIRQVKNGGFLSYAVFNFFGWNVLSSLEEEQRFVLLHLVFDYNKRNFVPESEPSLCPVDDIPEYLQQATYASAFPPLAANQRKVLVAVTIEGMEIAGAIPFTLERPPEEMFTGGTWNELSDILNGVKLQSSKFDTWPALLRQNLRSSIDNWVHTNAYFQSFLTNALWIPSVKSRHKTHIIMINMSMDMVLARSSVSILIP